MTAAQPSIVGDRRIAWPNLALQQTSPARRLAER
jgi:hypothetical protein